MQICPFCGTVNAISSKEWLYSLYSVRAFTCPKCNIHYRAYYRNGKLSHTIPKMPSNVEKVIAYLRWNETGNPSQIAEVLNLEECIIEEALAILFKEGIASPVKSFKMPDVPHSPES